MSGNEIHEASLIHDGEPRDLVLTYEGQGSYHYSFSTPLELHQGQNEIAVTATDTDGWVGGDSVVVYANIPTIGLRIELTWGVEGGDLDTHFIADGYGMWNALYDCCFLNMNPDWDGIGGSGTTGDPCLDVDDIDGYGPEYLVLEQPPYDGYYQYKVHYYNYCHLTTTATARVWVNDVMVATYTHTFICNNEEVTDSRALVVTTDPSIWDCACIEWDKDTGTASVIAGRCPD